tara:strand:+ start:6424 stop:7101 length:678 start_codon:yes stop_codon:yes gene_type:complete
LIFLTGGGEQESFHKLDQYFLEKLPDNTKILIIPQACDEEDYDDVLERIQESFSHKKIASVELEYTPKNLSLEKLMEFNVLMIEGGNTFQLINELRDSNFSQLLKQYAGAPDKFIYADSAGAIFLGADVQTAFLGDEGDEDHLKLQDYRGLDLISPWSVHAHYLPDDDEQIQDLVYEKGNPVIMLAEEAGVCIDQDTMQSLGERPVKLFTFSGIEELNSDEILRF